MTVIGWVLALCKYAFSVFYSPSLMGSFSEALSLKIDFIVQLEFKRTTKSRMLATMPQGLPSVLLEWEPCQKLLKILFGLHIVSVSAKEMYSHMGILLLHLSNKLFDILYSFYILLVYWDMFVLFYLSIPLLYILYLYNIKFYCMYKKAYLVFPSVQYSYCQYIIDILKLILVLGEWGLH